MTVPVVDPINQYVVVGGETTFTYNWLLNAEGDMVVKKESAGVVTTLTLNADYTVQDVGEEAGGTITPIGSESPVTVGDIWTLYRDTSVKRSTDFSTSGSFTADAINDNLDYLTQITQDRLRDSDNALKLDYAISDTLDPTIPQPVDGRTIKFKDTGGGAFEIIMSSVDPDTGSAEAQAAADEAEASADAAALSETNAATSESNAATSENNAATSASEAANSAASAEGLYQQTSSFNTTTFLVEGQNANIVFE